MEPIAEEVTELLIEWRAGEPQALARLTPLVYSELRRLAEGRLRRERSDHTLQATALVHEAYLRLVDKTHPQWKGRSHFFAVAAQQMRRILVDHARRSRAAKRGGDQIKVPIEGETVVLSSDRPGDLVILDEVLRNLESFDGRKARVIELRYFGGLSVEEVAEVLEVSTATVVNDTRVARAWLHREISGR
ncbi:MAG: sigma-70 family RNA polymerase sigma factor [Acidobacteriota bacterium]